MPSIIELLVKLQLLDERQHDAVMSRSRSTTGGHVIQQIAEMGYATEGTVARSLSVELGLPRIDLSMTPPELQALQLLDARTCNDRFVLPVALRENGELLWLAMADPTDEEAIGLVRRKTQKRVRPAVAGPSEILRAVKANYGPGGPTPERALGAIEIGASGADDAPFEVVTVGAEIGDSPLSRIAAQLGVDVPQALPSRNKRKPAEPPPPPQKPISVPPASDPPVVEAAEQKAVSEVPPETDPRIRAIRALSFDELFATATKGGVMPADDLEEDNLASLEALRASMEKGALVLRALAELCVEKKLFTRDEMRKRNQPKA